MSLKSSPKVIPVTNSPIKTNRKHTNRKHTKRVTFNNYVNSNKMCPNGNPKFPPKIIHWAYYLENYFETKCDNGKYIKYDDTKGKYCCSDTPASLEEMIEHCNYLLDIITNFTIDMPMPNNKIIENNTNNLSGKKAKRIFKKKIELLQYVDFIKHKKVLFKFWKSREKN